jgi:hypothetical protein
VLTYYLPKEKIRKVKNLLAGKEEEQEPESEPVQADEIVSHWHHVSYCHGLKITADDFKPELDFGFGLGRR